MTEVYEEFSEDQLKILEKYVTNTSSNIFALRNLPEVIKGALFSKYSRSSMGLKSLLLKEFILNEETEFASISCAKDTEEEQIEAIKRAQNFYDRILDGYGDDSIGELGGAHLAMENISMIAAKTIEDCRIGGSPLEKSTRYIYFNQKIGEYLFYKEPVLMTSAYRDIYLETCNHLFDTYSKLIPPLTAIIEKKFPREHNISKVAYSAALRAKVLDCLRGLLPASALTNIGIFGNGRFFEKMIQKLSCHNLTEMQNLGREAFSELSKLIPSFVRRAESDSRYQRSYSQFIEQTKTDLKSLADKHAQKIKKRENRPSVILVSKDPDSVHKVAAALLFEYSSESLISLQEYVKSLPSEELNRILDAAATSRENRRNKSPRGLENAYFTFEILADFGIYRDLQRHRILTQERQLLTCNYNYFIPKEIFETELEKEYVEAMEKAKKAYFFIATELPEEAQYVVPMAYNLRWYFTINLRSLQWLCELRSSPAGHPNYRYVAQELATQVCQAFPSFAKFFKFVDFEGHELGRMSQEIRRTAKKDG